MQHLQLILSTVVCKVVRNYGGKLSAAISMQWVNSGAQSVDCSTLIAEHQQRCAKFSKPMGSGLSALPSTQLVDSGVQSDA